MTTISDLSGDLVAEILSRVPFTSLMAVRCTCKTWNDVSKNHILGQKTAAEARKNQFLEFMVRDDRLFSLRVDLQGSDNKKGEDADLEVGMMKQISIPNHHQVEISQVYHCDGLLLCVPRDHSRRLLVWNPYLGQTRLIQPTNNFDSRSSYTYALGYDTSRNYKILRYHHQENLQVYDFSSDSWRVLDLDPDYYEPWPCSIERWWNTGMSLKGNTYFYIYSEVMIEGYLVCFDFTRERFGPRLPLPLLHVYYGYYSSLNHFWVRDEKLAFLYYDTWGMIEIWITTKVEPNAVSWSKFLTVEFFGLPGINALTGFSSFLIDEEREVVVLFHKDKETRRCQMACVIGKDKSFKSFKIGEALSIGVRPGTLVSSSYVPSLVQLQV